MNWHVVHREVRLGDGFSSRLDGVISEQFWCTPVTVAYLYNYIGIPAGGGVDLRKV